MYLATQILKSALVPILILLPAPGPSIERDMAKDIDRLQRAECEYKGITASFDELTRAYILKVYEQGELLRWQAEPSPFNPETETLVTAVFSAKRQKIPADTAAIAQIRNEAPPQPASPGAIAPWPPPGLPPTEILRSTRWRYLERPSTTLSAAWSMHRQPSNCAAKCRRTPRYTLSSNRVRSC